MGEEGRTSYIFGKVMKYNQGADWEAYTEQLDFYFLANGVTDDQTKKAILLSNVSTETYQLLKDLLVPATPKDSEVTYSVIVDRFQKHTKPEKSALVARYEFDNRSRQVSESVGETFRSFKERLKANKQPPATSLHVMQGNEDAERQDWTGLYRVSKGNDRKPISVTMEVENRKLVMELDTGSAVSVIGEEKYHEQLRHVPLESTTLQLHTYTGETVKPLGVLSVKVRYGEQSKYLQLYVMKGIGPTPLGREWLHSIRLNWPLMHLETPSGFPDVLDRHAAVFSDELGREWAAPIVTPIKKDGEVRICGDFKVTINPQLDVDEYLLPRIEEIYANLSGGQQFSVIDLRQAYLQMEVEEESKTYLTVNTHRGLYQYQRLPYAVASAPAVWQSAMDQVLQGIPGVQCYLDDIIVTGRTREEHLKALDKVLRRLEEHGLKAN
ncbi:hypothetical protein NP493_1730g00003 [Ridgeia piscesae]|uniref:Reverse transcriptase domain-containing protein n=1 Tax=Ridgeia piscesae TaxID=27915 RepID=A0AAD9JUP5_RIDPI|nr:hypothetical protein NP493_1730g00003 [Ridgeia piscesae]